MDRDCGLNLKSILLVEDQPTTGSWNMAIDDALLNADLPAQTAVLRLYQWKPACTSLGYFQPLQQRQSHQASAHTDCIRRASGGGAIVHDHELTYSFVFPLHQLTSAQISGVYDLFHDSLIRLFQGLGISATKCVDPPAVPKGEQPFLCFQRRAPGDVLIHQFKVVGSAQRRNRTHVLQHGSILLKQSTAAPELPGILELTHVDLTSLDWVTNWLADLSDIFQCQISSYSLTYEQLKMADKVEKERFLNQKWLQRR